MLILLDEDSTATGILSLLFVLMSIGLDTAGVVE